MGGWLYAKCLVYIACLTISTLLGVLFTFIILQRKKRKLPEVKKLAPGHTAMRSKG